LNLPVISSATIIELFTGAISFLLTLMVLSYLIGDNPAFRVAVYIFIGASAGYASAVAWHQVLYPRLIIPLRSGNMGEVLLAFIGLVLGLLLLLKLSPRTTNLGTPSLAFMVGVAAAVAAGGAVIGTLLPQISAAINLPGLGSMVPELSQILNPTVPKVNLERFFEGIVMILGTVATMVFFHFGAKATASGPQRNKLVKGLSWIGQIFVAITFGVLFAGVMMAAMTALIERIYFLISYLAFL
jgi:hypothetical protein